MIGLVRPIAIRPGRALRRWDPWTEMSRARQEMDDVMTRAFGFTPLARMFGDAAGGALPVELHESGESFVLRAHLPGMAREDINLEVTAHGIALWGERRRPELKEDVRVHLDGAGYGGFRFEYEFPVEIRSDEARATYRDGILEVTLPKVEAARPASFRVPIEG